MREAIALVSHTDEVATARATVRASPDSSARHARLPPSTHIVTLYSVDQDRGMHFLTIEPDLQVVAADEVRR